MRSVISPLVGAAIALGAGSAQAETVWNLATAYKDNNFHTQNIARFAKDARVLDGYCYSGGFAIQAALAGARAVQAIDALPRNALGKVQKHRLRSGEVLPE